MDRGRLLGQFFAVVAVGAVGFAFLAIAITVAVAANVCQGLFTVGAVRAVGFTFFAVTVTITSGSKLGPNQSRLHGGG